MVPGHRHAMRGQQLVAGTITTPFVDAVFAVAVHRVNRVGATKFKQCGRDVLPVINDQPFQCNIARGQFWLQPGERPQPEIDLDGGIVVQAPLCRRGDEERDDLALGGGLGEGRLVLDTQVGAQPAKRTHVISSV